MQLDTSQSQGNKYIEKENDYSNPIFERNGSVKGERKMHILSTTILVINETMFETKVYTC